LIDEAEFQITQKDWTNRMLSVASTIQEYTHDDIADLINQHRGEKESGEEITADQSFEIIGLLYCSTHLSVLI
uniref:Cytochrome P450 n=1 Tax=Gongylonema pulchrum TaxID=637853 RepID=A0A183EL38_9BILA